MEKTLQLILQKLESLESQTTENTQLLKAVINRQEETDAKLDNMAMDIHKLHGEVTSLEDQTVANSELKAPLENIIHRVDDLETDVKIIKKAISS